MPERGSRKIGVQMGWKSIIDGRLYGPNDERLRGRGNPPSDPSQGPGVTIRLTPSPVEVWQLADGSRDIEAAPTAEAGAATTSTEPQEVEE